MQGYKTYTGLLLAFLGILGWGDVISSDQVANFANAWSQLLGIILAVYGNYKAHREIKALGGYRN